MLIPIFDRADISSIPTELRCLANLGRIVHEGALGYPWFAWERPAVSWLKEGNVVFVGIVIVAVIALAYYNKSKVEARKQAHWITRYLETKEKQIISLIIKSCFALLIFAIFLLAIATWSPQIIFIILGILP